MLQCKRCCVVFPRDDRTEDAVEVRMFLTGKEKRKERERKGRGKGGRNGNTVISIHEMNNQFHKQTDDILFDRNFILGNFVC